MQLDVTSRLWISWAKKNGWCGITEVDLKCHDCLLDIICRWQIMIVIKVEIIIKI